MISKISSVKKWLSLIAIGFVALAGQVRAAETVTYYYTSPQGTVLATTDGVGNVLSTADYRPYGAQVLGASESGPGYTGHVNDPDSGLIYMQARYYDPTEGRFLSVDPEEVDGGDTFAFGRYSYGSLNPIVNIDPDGRQSCVPEGCTVGPTPYNAFRDSFIGQEIGHLVGDPVAVLRSDNMNPLTNQVLDRGQIQEAKLGVLTLAIPASRTERVAADVAKQVVTGFTKHAVDRAIDRGVKPAAILDAIKNPLKVTSTKVDSKGMASYSAVGSKATVIINPESGKIVTVTPTSSSKVRSLLRQQESVP